MTLDDGWEALRDARWGEARSLFARAIEAEPEARAWEGLSWASWWLDDRAAVLEARERAFAGYRDDEDERSAARMAVWLAADLIDFEGALATANGWLERAARLLASVEPSAEHGWLAFHRGYVAIIQGKVTRAGELGGEAARVGRACRVADLEMLGLALQGSTLVSRGQVADGMRRLDEASAIALSGEATIPISGAWTCCFMVTACIRVLDFDRAFEWCDRIAAFAERYGSRYMLGFCRAEYATVHLWRGRYDEAERALEESLAALEASRPVMAGGPRASLAELRRRQGRIDEARRLLERCGGSSKGLLCLARCALDDDDPRLALELSQRALRNISDERPVDRAPALEVATRAQLALGELDAAATSRDRLAGIVGRVETAGLEAQLLAIDGLLRAARGQPAAAQPRLEDAVDRFERCDAPFDAACARLDLAVALRTLGREHDARAQAELASASLSAMGAAAAAERAASFLADDPRPERDAPAASPISKRETEVLELVARGMTNRAIAEALCISEHTVHRHVNNILRKLDVPSRAAATAVAVNVGLVIPE